MNDCPSGPRRGAPPRPSTALAGRAAVPTLPSSWAFAVAAPRKLTTLAAVAFAFARVIELAFVLVLGVPVASITFIGRTCMLVAKGRTGPGPAPGPVAVAVTRGITVGVCAAAVAGRRMPMPAEKVNGVPVVVFITLVLVVVTGNGRGTCTGVAITCTGVAGTAMGGTALGAGAGAGAAVLVVVVPDVVEVVGPFGGKWDCDCDSWTG